MSELDDRAWKIEERLRKCLTDQDGYDYIYDLLEPSAEIIRELRDALNRASLARIDHRGF